jgi:bacterioferritin
MKTENQPPNPKVMELLHEIFKAEMSGITRYLHYSLMVFGYHRIPIQKWFREQANESMQHALVIGEKITSYGGHPPVASAGMEETNVHTLDQILKESLAFEEAALALYKDLVAVAGDDIALEELARSFVREETEHLDEVRKMLRRPE